MCSTLLVVKGNIIDTVVEAFDSVMTLNDIFITSTMSSTLLGQVKQGQVKYSCHSYKVVMTTKVKTNHNV